MTDRRRYFSICNQQDSSWLLQCLADPSPRQTPGLLLILRLVLRKRGIETLAIGARLWNGRTVSRDMARAYHWQSARAQGWREAGLPVPDAILNGLHNLVR